MASTERTWHYIADTERITTCIRTAFIITKSETMSNSHWSRQDVWPVAIFTITCRLTGERRTSVHIWRYLKLVKKFLAFLWNSKIHCRVYQSLSYGPVRSQLTPIITTLFISLRSTSPLPQPQWTSVLVELYDHLVCYMHTTDHLSVHLQSGHHEEWNTNFTHVKNKQTGEITVSVQLIVIYMLSDMRRKGTVWTKQKYMFPEFNLL